MWKAEIAYFGLIAVWLPVSTLAIEEGPKMFNNTTKREMVNLEVFYEALCPDCMVYFREQLAPAVRALGDRLYVKIVPYGHARRRIQDGKPVFRCQHGGRECLGNRLHACAADALGPTTLGAAHAALFADCLMSHSDDNDALYACSDSFNLDAAKIDDCAKGDKGGELLNKMGERSDQINYQYVPYAMVNGRAPADAGKEPPPLLPALCAALAPPPPPCARTSPPPDTEWTWELSSDEEPTPRIL